MYPALDKLLLSCHWCGIGMDTPLSYMHFSTKGLLFHDLGNVYWYMHDTDPDFFHTFYCIINIIKCIIIVIVRVIIIIIL